MQETRGGTSSWAISKNRGELGVDSVGRGARGERWAKIASTHAERHAPRESTSRSVEPALHGTGPQYADDPRFTARMRLHQSWWRAQVLKVPFGLGPQASSTSRYGNMLRREEAEIGKNFLTDEIFAVAKARLAEGRGAVEPFRLLHNLLTSQAMCFNLFGPLAVNAERATRLVKSLLGADEVARVSRVAIEWAPDPAASYLGDRTAFDAVVEYERPDGSRALLGIETKLTDSFSQKAYDGEKYRRWMRSVRSPFRPDAASKLATPRFNQVWRNHLLAIAVRDHAQSRYAAARSIVLHHPLDADARSVLASYRELLVAGDETFAAWTLDEVVRAFASAATPDEAGWLADLQRRYLDLDVSASALSRGRHGESALTGSHRRRASRPRRP